LGGESIAGSKPCTLPVFSSLRRRTNPRQHWCHRRDPQRERGLFDEIIEVARDNATFNVLTPAQRELGLLRLRLAGRLRNDRATFVLQ